MIQGGLDVLKRRGNDVNPDLLLAVLVLVLLYSLFRYRRKCREYEVKQLHPLHSISLDS